MSPVVPSSPGGLSIRAARSDDVHLLYEWANDPAVRANSFHREPIPWETHVCWYAERLHSPNTRFWLLEESGIALGQIRYDRRFPGTEAVINFSVAQAHRGKGHGLKLVTLTRPLAVTDLQVREMAAMVIQGNHASYRTFLRAGFSPSALMMLRGQPGYRFCWRLLERYGSVHDESSV
jgi:UDP-2,4-diacetamido-2,4,6-trideoxy-beta-L-altropyranose hydrolase